MDVFLGGSGFSFKIAMETADSTDRQHFFKVNTVNVDVANLQIKMKQSNHKLLFNLAKPLLLKVLKPVVQKVLEKQLKDTATEIDSKLWAVHQEAKRAEAEAKKNPDPDNAQSIYQRYATAAQKNFMNKKKKAQEQSADKKVNMAVTQHESIFPNIKLPGGISSKATEYKDLARKGDKWESPVFSIGSAKESSNIPKMGPIRRRQGGGGGSSNRGTSNTASSGARSGGATAGSGAGYGAGANTGYGSGANAGYSNVRSGATTNGAAGLSSQMNQAFDGTNDLSLGKNAGMNGNTVRATEQHTTLGTHNPVLTGSV